MQKATSLQRAQGVGVASARLPLDEFGTVVLRVERGEWWSGGSVEWWVVGRGTVGGWRCAEVAATGSWTEEKNT